MSAISSESIFHFTKAIENLIGILRNEFFPGLSYERYELRNTIIKGYFPMVSFCDIPLSQITQHARKYGKYGIGMSKIWAQKMGLNPVLYIRRRSHLARHIEALSTVLESEYKPEGKPSEVQKALMSLLRYIKPFEGDYLKGRKVEKPIKFYDEREVRYVPPPEMTRGRYFLSVEAHEKQRNVEHFNEILKQARLRFEPDDIRYIIVAKESEILEMGNEVRKMKDKYKPQIQDKLITRIISYQQIKEDF